MCAAMFQNSNSLPIALIQSLVIEVPGLKWGENDTKDQMLGRALTYLVLYSTLGMMFRWSWGVRLLAAADDEVDETDYKHVSVPPPVGAGVGDQVQINNADADARTGEPGSYLVQSPEAGTDQNPFFSTQDAEAAEEGRGRSKVTTKDAGALAQSPASSAPFTAPGSAHSAHPMNTARRGSSNGPVSFSRRMSSQSRTYSQSSYTRKKPTRTESGREFWGLPNFPKDRGIVLEEEDSSDDDDGEPEFVSHKYMPSVYLQRERLGGAENGLEGSRSGGHAFRCGHMCDITDEAVALYQIGVSGIYIIFMVMENRLPPAARAAGEYGP